MKKIIKENLLLNGVHKARSAIINFNNNYLDGYSKKSYSHEGEDMILRSMFEKQKNGFYIDVGAHHPKRFSNTYYFYKKGWRGINIDAMPGSMNLFKKIRKRDINLEIPISDKEETVNYYIFNELAANTFSDELAKEKLKNEGRYIRAEKYLKCKTMAQVLGEYLPVNQSIDFLSVDTEGYDLKVLKSNNWEKYVPECVLVEVIGLSIEDLINSELTHFMKDNGYVLFSKILNTIIYKKRISSL